MTARRLAVLGSTGSIGTQTLEVVRRHPDRFAVDSLVAGRNADLLREQIAEFRPRVAALLDPEGARRLRAEGLPAIDAADAAARCAAAPTADIVVNGIPRADGLDASLAAVEAGKRLALANKESMVLAGPLLRERAKATGAEILPVDSEHSAIFQAMRSGREAEVRRVYLTASGGPFRTKSREEIAAATPEAALKHPTWEMGRKITIDSATLMNKALEIVEARWLFDLEPDRIEVVVHPQSIIHSMVEFVDGSIVAQLGAPDMRLPIQYALTWPERWEGFADGFDFAGLGRITFEAPDRERFPSLDFGYRAAREGGVTGAVLNAANDVAVEAFLDGRIPFPAIFDIVGGVLDDAPVRNGLTREAIREADAWARAAAMEAIPA